MLTATRTHPGNRAAAILPLILVFLCGVSVGALVMSLGHTALHSSPSKSRTDNAVTLERWKRDLNLNDEQSEKIGTILDDFSKYYDNVLADGNTRILQVLDDKQKAKFRQMLKDRH
jgi:uncharacterized membrane-anchored protein YhcB (DUF1043 family)